MSQSEQRSIEVPYDHAPDREPNLSRRGFMQRGGLVAAGATIAPAASGVLLSASPALSQAAGGGASAAPAAEKGPQLLKFPGKNEKLVVLGERPLVDGVASVGSSTGKAGGF